MTKKLRTNVIKRDYTVPVVRKKDGLVMLIIVNAESFEAAKLLIGDEYRFDEDSVAKTTKMAEN